MWASWCPPCLAELPLLISVTDEVRIHGINCKYKRADAVNRLERNGNSFIKSGHDPQGEAVCHGANATGIEQGPPLLHKIYESGHHPDASFQRAVKQGVMSHHWRFGHMPPVPGISRKDVAKIIVYVRELQRANGIF